MTKQANFIKKQYEFAAHIRDPENNSAPSEIEDRRMNIYRDLFYNNIEDFISSGFPVLRKLYNDENWHLMVRDFVAHHQSETPYFLEISQEFLHYLENEHELTEYDPPFLLELAHYEWVELALTVSDATNDFNNIDTNADLLASHPVLSPLAWLLSYNWPVHQLGPDFQPEQAPQSPTHIIVYRDRTDEVRFIILNPVTARLIYLLQEDNQLTGKHALEKIAEEMQHPNPQVVLQGGLQALEDLKSHGIILGASQINLDNYQA